MGEVDSANISINGSKYYGIFDTINSVSQGIAIDSDISAKCGDFTGGVIDSKTRDPRSGFHGKFYMQHTQDSRTRFHI
ncbi:hypothetical protein KDE13_04150 [Campylobacter sp. faydin G-140]|nr:hypothetical protein [Campylobacter anatolicus]MBR8465552.1 hypothetical protein [Campylobacter anatolicus]